MKILIVSSKYLPAVGGLEIAVEGISKELINSGHKVLIITNRHSRRLPASEIMDDISVKRYYFTDISARFRNFWIWLKWLFQLLFVPLSFFQLFCQIKKFSPDIVHLHYAGTPSLYVLAAKFLLHFPLVVSLHGADVEGFERKSRLGKLIFKKVIAKADFLTANAQHLLKEALRCAEIQKKDSRIVSMGFSFEVYDHVRHFSHPRPYLFAAGRFVYKKGFDVLIRAFSSLIKKNYPGDLLIAGVGGEGKNYYKLCKELNLESKIFFLGNLNKAAMASVMKGCDLCVIPSRQEAFGIITLEALYAGKRVVASHVGGIPEIMADNPQQLVPPGNSELLAEKIEETLQRKTIWNVVDSQKLKQKYNWFRVTADFMSIYKEMRRCA